MKSSRVLLAVSAWSVVGVLWAGASGDKTHENPAVSAMMQEGYTAENCRLRAKRIIGHDKKVPVPFSKETFPYDWNFDDGTRSGIVETGSGIRDMRVEDGVLKFATGSGNNTFSWGDYVKTAAPLRFGFDIPYFLDRLAYFKIRIRQSLPESTWKAEVHSSRRPQSSPPFKITGTDWQTVDLPILQSSRSPYTGVRFLTETPDNKIEIDWIKPCMNGGRPCKRKTFVLSSPVRWARCSISAGPCFTLYVNGARVVQSPMVNDLQIWNYELDPSLFRTGKNVIAFENEMTTPFVGWTEGLMVLDGALLCEDGSYHRFDSDETWKTAQLLEGTAWTEVNYDDHGWSNAVVRKNLPLNTDRVYWFNPSYKGRIDVRPSDGRSQPVYGSREDIALEIAVPRREGEEHAVTYELLDEMGDGYHTWDTSIGTGDVVLEQKGKDDVGVLAFNAGELRHNRAYAVVFHLMVDEERVEKRRYEVAVCGPVEQPVVENPESYTNGMDLKLVWETDAADPQKEGTFVSCDGNAKPRESRIIETSLGRFRQPWPDQNLGSSGGEPCNYISFLFTVEHPGRPHVVIAEYPDDTVRSQEMRVSDVTSWKAMVTMANDTVMLGYQNPLSGEIRYHHALFFPNNPTGTVSFFSLSNADWQPEKAARVGKIRIYEVLNDVPARKIVDAPGPRKWLGHQPESGPRVAVMSCFSSPIASLFREYLIAADAPYFYRNWLLTTRNLIKRLRFGGENAYYMGQYMYEKVFHPSEFSNQTAFEGAYHGGSLRDYGALMAKMFEENDMALFTALEMTGFSQLKIPCPDYDVARGAETLAQVNKLGQQQVFFAQSVVPNWIHPTVREKYFETVINEYIELYGGQKGWKGIVLQVNEVLGPSWASGGSDPYFCSYDDYTISLFEEETGVKVPVDPGDTQRFSKRYAWLLANAKEEWTTWRCARMSELYDWVKTRLKETRPDLQFVLYPQAVSYIFPPVDMRGDERDPIPEYGRRGGLDVARFVKDKDTILALAVSGSADASAWMHRGKTINMWRYRAHDESLLNAFSNDGKNGITVRYNWYEAQPVGPPGWVWKYTAAESWPYPSAEFFADYWVNIFIRSNPSLILHGIQDVSMWMGREVSMSRFAQVFRSLPVTTYTRLRGEGRDINVWISTGEFQGSVYGYVANSQWWPVDAELNFGGAAVDLVEREPVPGNKWALHLAPYGIRSFRLSGVPPADAVTSCSTTVGEKGRRAVESLVKDASERVESNEALLKAVNRYEFVMPMLEDAKAAVAEGDFSTAYEILTSYPYTSVWTRKPQDRRAGAYVPRRAVARKRVGPIVIDGRGTEWPEESTIVISEKGQVFPAAEKLSIRWKGAEDLSARIGAQWDEENLYLFFDVTDDRLFFHPAVLHEGDSIEVYFDTELGKDMGATTYSEDDSHFKFAPSPEKDGGVRLYRKRSQRRDLSTDDVEAAWTRKVGGYRVEAGIPWSLIRDERIGEGLSIGFDVMLNDAESPKLFKQYMIWSSDQVTCSKDPSRQGILVMGDEEGRGPSTVTVKSTHEAYKRADALYKERNFSEALGQIRSALQKDVWDKQDEDDIQRLKKAYRLAYDIARDVDDRAAFLEMTADLIDDPTLPLDLKAGVVAGLRSSWLYRVDPDAAREEAQWLIEAPGIADSWRAYGYNVLYVLEKMKGRDADQQKMLEYLLHQQTLRGGKVSYLYDDLGDNRFAAGDFGPALAFYLRAWNLIAPDFYPHRLAKIEKRIPECLRKLGHAEEADAWKAWLATPSENRGDCPAIGIVKVPEAWESKWRVAPDGIDGNNPLEVPKKIRALIGVGRIADCGKWIEEALSVSGNRMEKDLRTDMLLLRKWGPNPPETVP